MEFLQYLNCNSYTTEYRRASSPMHFLEEKSSATVDPVLRVIRNHEIGQIGVILAALRVCACAGSGTTVCACAEQAVSLANYNPTRRWTPSTVFDQERENDTGAFGSRFTLTLVFLAGTMITKWRRGFRLDKSKSYEA